MTNPELQWEAAPMTVLVVEDEVLVRLLICDALREAGLVVVEAGDADEALGYLKSDPIVRLVFSDVRMPGSMDGLELARLISQDLPETKVVLASGHLLPDDLVEGTVLFPKPYPIELTVEKIIDILKT